MRTPYIGPLLLLLRLIHRNVVFRGATLAHLEHYSPHLVLMLGQRFGSIAQQQLDYRRPRVVAGLRPLHLTRVDPLRTRAL